MNVLGALLSNGKIFSAAIWKTVDAFTFAGFLGLLREHVGRPLTIILDNASIHKAHAIQDVLKVLELKGVTLYFLPPYSPELNRIEMIWRLTKHKWMGVKHRDSATLETDVKEVLDNVGTRYAFDF